MMLFVVKECFSNSQKFFFKIIKDEEGGVLIFLLRLALSVLSILYFITIKIRMALYKIGLFKSVKVEKKVVGVGNITAGGTGKTPFVELITKELVKKGKKISILSRGYKSIDDENDEVKLLKKNINGAEHLIGKKRHILAKQGVDEHDSDIILLDDGFQFFKLKKDVEIVLIDCTNPFGYGHLIPRGLLREPVSGLRRADLIVLTHTELATEDSLNDIITRVRKVSGEKLFLEAKHKAVCLSNDKEEHELKWIEGKRIIAFSGIGNPLCFEESLKKLGAELEESYRFDDHHNYTQSDLHLLISAAKNTEVELLVTTQKDFIKINQLKSDEIPIFFLRIIIEITEGEEHFNNLLNSLV